MFAFAKAADVPHRPKPQEPPPSQKSPEQTERDAIMAKIRRHREAPPKCAVNENIRLAPTASRGWLFDLICYQVFFQHYPVPTSKV